jgi:hypothetical protein
MFEPFHPKMVRGMRELCFYQYIRPDDSGHRFLRRASEVFSGRFCSVRTDHANWRLSYRGLLIKDIFANLLACWASQQFPAVKMVFLIRNPFAVALSKSKRRNWWYWLADPSELLRQESLVQDCLQPFEDVIRGVGDDFILRQVLIWAILHYVPFRQFEPGRVRVVFYEDVVRHPERELLRLFRYLKPDAVDSMMAGALQIVTRPSRVTERKKNAPGGVWPIGQWRSEVSAEQVREGLKILAHFGLDQIYGDDAMPRPEFLPGLETTEPVSPR